MWNWNITVSMKSEMKWEDVYTYWDAECHKMMHLHALFSEFLF